MFKEFKTFIMRGNVLDMAVGIIIGAAFICSGIISSSLNLKIKKKPASLLSCEHR